MISSSRRCGWLHATGQNPFGSGYSVFQDLLRTWDVASVEPELGIERGFPGSRKSDSRCWLGNGGQHGWASHIRLTFGNGFRLRSPSERASNPRRAIDLAQHLDRAADRTAWPEGDNLSEFRRERGDDRRASLRAERIDRADTPLPEYPLAPGNRLCKCCDYGACPSFSRAGGSGRSLASDRAA
jgi:hypothetical protein